MLLLTCSQATRVEIANYLRLIQLAPATSASAAAGGGGGGGGAAMQPAGEEEEDAIEDFD